MSAGYSGAVLLFAPLSPAPTTAASSMSQCNNRCGCAAHHGTGSNNPWYCHTSHAYNPYYMARCKSASA